MREAKQKIHEGETSFSVVPGAQTEETLPRIQEMDQDQLVKARKV